MKTKEPKKKDLWRKLAVISLVVWILSIIVFLVSSASFSASANANNGFYTPFQTLVFLLTIGSGVISFLTFCGILFLKFWVKSKLLISGVILGSVVLVVFLVVLLINNFTNQGLCKRRSPYDLQPEFQRGLSLLIQRYTNSSHIKEEDKKIYQNMENCVFIEYRNFRNSGEEQEAWFLPEESSNNKLVIQVDETYSQMDDLSIAFLLSHELTHAKQFLEKDNSDNISFEVEAFRNQLIFASQLNNEELNSLEQRLKSGSQNTQLQILNDLWNISSISINRCGVRNLVNIPKNQLDCFSSELDKNIRVMVIELGYK